MIGSHILRLDPVNHHLRFCHFTSTEIFSYSRTSKQVINLLSTGTIQLCSMLSSILTTTTTDGASTPFDLSPIISQVFGSPSLVDIPPRLLALSPKVYKLLDRLHNPATLRPFHDSSPRNSLSRPPVLPARVWMEL
ncbi:hypothetical protein BCV72DRAFT_306537 [Rhizopus microsporus var. microsporus]|uniref:Uncharacterized protein n=1 Tax=Rhizopus microsporus var. microsporus TaxID=86635 RepID=A0A1X0R034_RHIZD|nr:hypothetical protein BCV72DRAFT_306537 [Rhizopus microsporus var. microsporus]